MVHLSDAQLAWVMDGAAPLPPEKRSSYLTRMASMLTLRGRISDRDIREVIKLAQFGLVQGFPSSRSTDASSSTRSSVLGNR